MRKRNVLGMLVMLLAAGLLFTACDKDTPEKTDQTPKTKPACTGDHGSHDHAKTAVAAPASGAAMKLTIPLPKPLFAGTPKPPKGVTNLEPPKPKGWKRPLMSVPAGTTNIAKGKAVTASDDFVVIGEFEQLTDGDKDGSDGCFVEMMDGKQWVQIDLGKPATIYAIALWHFHKQARVYHDVVVQVANDEDFTENVKTVFNNDNDNSSGLGAGKDLSYLETYEGKLIDAKGVEGRYVRFYSSGNTSDSGNHYIELDVYGVEKK